MRVDYDDEFHILRVDAASRAESSSLLYDDDVVVNVGTEDGRDIVGVEVWAAPTYFPLGKRGYDAKTDTLTMGRTTNDPELINECGDFVGYWQPDPKDAGPGAYHYAIGVALKRASVHLAEVSAQIAGVPV